MAFDYLHKKPGPRQFLGDTGTAGTDGPAIEYGIPTQPLRARRYLRGLDDVSMTYDAGVQQMQAALVTLALKSNRPNIRPDVTTGYLTDGTMGAVVAAMDILTNALPATEYLALQATLLLGATTDAARSLVIQYAPDIASAALGASLTVTPATSAPPIFSLAWFESPIGLGILLIGGILGYKLFIAPPAQ